MCLSYVTIFSPQIKYLKLLEDFTELLRSLILKSSVKFLCLSTYFSFNLMLRARLLFCPDPTIFINWASRDISHLYSKCKWCFDQTPLDQNREGQDLTEGFTSEKLGSWKHSKTVTSQLMVFWTHQFGCWTLPNLTSLLKTCNLGPSIHMIAGKLSQSQYILIG